MEQDRKEGEMRTEKGHRKGDEVERREKGHHGLPAVTSRAG